MVGVVGDAGVGKSRLCREFVEPCRVRAVTVYEVHCPAHGAAVPWLAMRELLRNSFGLSGGEEPEAAREPSSDSFWLSAKVSRAPSRW